MEVAQSQLPSASELLPMTELLLMPGTLQFRMAWHRRVAGLPVVSGLP